LDPGCAEIDGTFSLILTHSSGSFGFGGTSCMAGNGQRLQGSPGHKHPLQLACTGKANTTNHKLQIRIEITLSTDCIDIFIPFINILIPLHKSQIFILNKRKFHSSYYNFNINIFLICL